MMRRSRTLTLQLGLILSLTATCLTIAEKLSGSTKCLRDPTFYGPCRTMIHNHLAARGLTNQPLLDAMASVPRHLFVPPDLRSEAYEDHALPIGYSQTISQPYIVAFTIHHAEIRPTDRVLEIGTGSGYNAAVLSRLCAEVFTIELIPELSDEAMKVIEGLGYTNIHAKAGDGYKGWPEEGPFDVIVGTAAPEKVPEALKHQLKIGGRLVLPVGGFGEQELVKIVRVGEDQFYQTSLLPVMFVPMRHGSD